uniref:FIST domain-containing protein n=2 Tax=Bellilinea TaxID=475960 RepID=A0A7C4KZZ0_9CHLR
MSLVSAVGYSNEINGREAAQQAAQQALKGLRSAEPKVALVFFSHLYDPVEVRQVLNGLLGDIPLWGATTSTIYAAAVPQKMTVVILGGAFSLDTSWYGHYAVDPLGSALELNARLGHSRTSRPWHSVLLAADGLKGEINTLLSYFEQVSIEVGGFLSGAGFPRGKNSLLGETYCAEGGLSALWLGSGIRVGMAAAQGWKDSGVYFRATASREHRLMQLDGQPAAEQIFSILGYSPAEWRKPPFQELLRLFPLAYHETGQSEAVLAAPVGVEQDGSLRMNLAIPEGSTLRLMVGNPSACLQSLKTAIQTAKGMAGGGSAGGVGMILVDVSWFELFRTQPAKLSGAIEEAAAEMPWIGVATLGHIWRGSEVSAPLAGNSGALAVVFKGES